MLVFKAWRKSPALTQETTPSQRRIIKMLNGAQQAAANQVGDQLPRVAELLSRGRVNEVGNLLPMDPWVDVQEPLAYELLGELLDAGSRVRLPAIQKAELVYSFDRGRPESAAWAWNQAGQLIVEITQQQRQVVQSVVSTAALGDTVDWVEVARLVRDSIGLTERQAGWVSNHRDRAYTTAIRNGASTSRAAAIARESAARYQAAVHRYRANTIARTETMRAASEGRRQAWDQGMTEGFIDPLWQKEWIAEADACDICQAIDGQRIGVKDSFSVGEPPAHPNCRCDVLLVPPKPQGQPTSPWQPLRDLETGFDLGQVPGQLFDGGLGSVPAPDKPEPTFIGMPSGVFIGMPKVVTFASILADATELRARAAPRRSEPGDPLLSEMYRVRGFDGLPTVVEDEVFDDLVANGARPLYRGIYGDNAADYLDAFRTGEYFPGLGMYGNGTYASSAFEEAFSYAGSKGDQVVRMVLAPGANVIRYDDLIAEWRAFLRSTDFDALPIDQRILLEDLGRYAVARGYDALDVGNNYYVIYNRSRVTVAATNGLGPRTIYARDMENAWYAWIRENMVDNREAVEAYGIDGMEAWAYDQGYRTVLSQAGQYRPLRRPQN